MTGLFPWRYGIIRYNPYCFPTFSFPLSSLRFPSSSLLITYSLFSFSSSPILSLPLLYFPLRTLSSLSYLPSSFLLIHIPPPLLSFPPLTLSSFLSQIERSECLLIFSFFFSSLLFPTPFSFSIRLNALNAFELGQDLSQRNGYLPQIITGPEILRGAGYYTAHSGIIYTDMRDVLLCVCVLEY